MKTRTKYRKVRVDPQELFALDRAIQRQDERIKKSERRERLLKSVTLGGEAMRADLELLEALRSRLIGQGEDPGPGPIQTLILRAMEDGKARDWNAMSAAIAAKFGKRIEVGSIHAACSGMINCRHRQWLFEHTTAEHQPRVFSITERGRKALA